MKELVRKSAFVILWGVVALPVTVACIGLALWDGYRVRRMIRAALDKDAGE